MYEYFDIFLSRMSMCSRADRILDAQYSLKVSGQKVLYVSKALREAIG
jgi:hypothetical protein